MSKVESLFGGPVTTREPNAICVDTLRDLLERAEAGEIVGVVVAAVHYDGCATFELGGMLGGYSLLGALEMAKLSLAEHVA